MIAVIGATLTEISGLLNDMKISERFTDGLPYVYKGTLNKIEMILAMSGIGKEKALRAINDLTERYSPDIVISIGVAGAVDPGLETGDIVLAQQIMCQEAGDGSLFSDKSLLDFAREACEKMNRRSFTGNLLTVPEVVASKNNKAEIFRKNKSLAVEMETYYIARETGSLGIPFLGVRAISDTADQSIDVDFKRLKQGMMQKVLYFLTHPSAYFRLREFSRVIHMSSVHMGQIINHIAALYAESTETIQFSAVNADKTHSKQSAP